MTWTIAVSAGGVDPMTAEGETRSISVSNFNLEEALGRVGNSQGVVKFYDWAATSESSSAGFAEMVVSQICEALNGRFDGCDICLRSFDATAQTGEPLSVLELDLNKSDASVAFGIVFPSTFGEIYRHDFDRQEWERTPESPLSAGIQAVSMAEAWRIATLISLSLRSEKLTMGYGL